MDTKKFLTGTIVGGIAFFLVGYLIYGLALTSFFTQHSTAPPGSMRAMSDFVWWSLILGNIASGALLTYLFLKMGNINSFGAGAGVGAVVGFLVELTTDSLHYAMENSSDLTGVIVDVLAALVLWAIAGGIVAAVLGMGKKKA
jgi:hypothetical protein